MRRQGDAPVRPITQIKGYDALVNFVNESTGTPYIVLGDVKIGGVNPVVYFSKENETKWYWALMTCNDTSDDDWYMVDGSEAINGSDVSELPCSTIAVTEASAKEALEEITSNMLDKGIELEVAAIEERSSDPGVVIVGLFTQS